jgi:hypothetical protein
MTRPVFEEGYSKEDARAGYRVSQLERRPFAGGAAVYQIEVFEPDKIVYVADEHFEWEIPEDLDECTLLKVDAYLTTPSSSGTVQVQLTRLDQGDDGDATDILSTKIGIEVGEVNLKESATQPVIADPEHEYRWGDHIRVDVDNAGSGAYGLGLITYWAPAAIANITIKGAKGDPGGNTNFTGPWTDDGGAGHEYLEGDVVNVGGTSYVALVDHTSSAASEPGVGVDWEDYWMVLSEAQKTSSVDVIIEGQNYPIDIGRKVAVRVPYDCVLTECMMLADQSGSMVVDIWKDTYGNYPPDNSDSIVSTSPPTLSGTDHSIDTILAGWTTALAEDDILAFNVDSCSVITRVTISLKFEKV